MSKYTTKYLDILQNYALPQTNLDFDTLVNGTYQDFWNFDFPWYASDGTGKDEFKKLFLLHYITREIGQETIYLHRAFLASRLREIMPYYQGVYETLTLEFPWDGNVDVQYTGTESRNEDSTTSTTEHSEGSSNSQTDTQSIDSENPQVTIQTNDYASSMNRGESTGSQNIENDATRSQTYEGSSNVGNQRTEKGYRGLTRGEIVKDMRDAIYNINLEIIDRCEDLFLGVWT